jgi:CheY-like chemotaxis protein
MNALEVEPARILVVEDNVADVYLIQEALKEHGVACSLQVAADGRDALQTLTAHAQQGEPPDLILLDLNLPRLSGREVLRRVRSMRGFDSVPIVILTSSSASDDVEEARRLGADEYIVKPGELGAFMAIGATLKAILGRPDGRTGGW